MRAAPADELMVIGGAEVFALAMAQLDVIQLTRVHCTHQWRHLHAAACCRSNGARCRANIARPTRRMSTR